MFVGGTTGVLAVMQIYEHYIQNIIVNYLFLLLLLNFVQSLVVGQLPSFSFSLGYLTDILFPQEGVYLFSYFQKMLMLGVSQLEWAWLELTSA